MCEERIDRLNERSALLESNGRLATEEKSEMQEQLKDAEGKLKAARDKGEVLEAQLRTLEKEALEAQAAQEHLR